ncbi:hypothetical protein C8R43DRAFT_1139824 [Mycena crocata]|nr:hypothetical protein C8R43DRAFT_1139824 [Mycena crocata]
MRDDHRQLPFHQVEAWRDNMFERITLKSLGVRIQLGHWCGPERRCPVPKTAPDDDFVIIDSHGVHEVGLDFCGCGQGGLPTVQLLRAGLFPATTTNPRTAATFAVLRRFHLMSFESKCAAYEFYQSLARETNNMHHRRRRKKGKGKGKKGKAKATSFGRRGEHWGGEAEESSTTEAAGGSDGHDTETAGDRKRRRKRRGIPNRYQEFLRMTREWRHIQMLKRAARGHDPGGIPATKPGECALLCPACPQPGKNMESGWEEAPEEKRFLHALFLAMDANFRLKRKDVSTEEKDPGLGKGWAFYCEVEAYMEHVKKHWNYKQERSRCVAHDAVDKPDREARGTASSGIGAVDCARHNMKRPLAVGDLQLGERYINMDYMFLMSVADSPLVTFFVSYDIACQWHVNIGVRMNHYANDVLTIDGVGKYMTFLIPKFHLPAHIEECNLLYSFNLTRDVGQTDGEAPERGWSNTNPLARSTREMGPGSRRDTLDDHFNDWNHKKIIALGYFLRRKMENAIPEMVETKRALEDMDESVGATAVENWTAMAIAWEGNPKAENPFATLRKDEHIAQVRRKLAEAAAVKEAAGTEGAGAVRGDMHITELVAMGLQVEEQQRVLEADVKATGLHPTDEQRRAMIERTSKLRRKITAWMDVQVKFFPTLATVRELEDAARALAAEGQPVPGISVWDMQLLLPSAIIAALWAREVQCTNEILDYEYQLRVGQANESLHEVRRLLLVRTHLYKLKDTHARGVRANTRSGDKIAALNDRINRAAVQYRWEWTLQVLKEEDVRGLPRARFSDPDKKKKKKSRAKRARVDKVTRELSWIWINRGGKHEPGDEAAMNEAVRIEWAKARARCMRWAEEVDLLEEEMRRVQHFLLWRAEWWKEQIGRRGLEDGPQLEGETAYALRQSALQMKLRGDFMREWKALPELVRKGRAGELEDEHAAGAQDGRDGDESEEEDDDASSGEEEEPISLLPGREVKSTYVDEILTYT